MNDFFDLDAPLFRFLTRVADMVILSLLWLNSINGCSERKASGRA